MTTHDVDWYTCAAIPHDLSPNELLGSKEVEVCPPGTLKGFRGCKKRFT